mgnify:CR=1 FL=1
MGTWLNDVFGSDVASVFAKISELRNHRFCMEGFVSATRETIRKHPLYVYSAIHEMQVFANEEIDHYMERSWEALFMYPGAIQCHMEEMPTVSWVWPDGSGSGKGESGGGQNIRRARVWRSRTGRAR